MAILLFGARRLPEAARSLGRSARILKAEVAGLHDDTHHQPASTERSDPDTDRAERVRPRQYLDQGDISLQRCNR
jgi:Sec-independent protein translocase protein TatA